MSAPIAASRAWRRHAWWLLPELSVLALLAMVLPFTLPSERFEEQLAAHVTSILEQLPADEHHQHGHDVAADDTVICVVEVMGADPVDAGRIEQVRTVYAYFFCAAGKAGTPWDFSRRIAGPVVVSLADPPVVTIADAGAGYPDRVRAMMPEQFHERSFAGFTDPDIPSALRSRYQDEIA